MRSYGSKFLDLVSEADIKSETNRLEVKFIKYIAKNQATNTIDAMTEYELYPPAKAI
jgi:hypothetical protein